MKERVIVVTGGNRGIGYEICRQLAQKGVTVVLTSRNEEEGRNAVDNLEQTGLSLHYHPLDVTDHSQIKDLKNFLIDEFGGCDGLVNNAGIFADGAFFEADPDEFHETMETNVYGPHALCQALVPLMNQNNYGRIVNMSSGLGQLSDMGQGYIAYRVSKTALNVLTRVLAAELGDANILVNSMAPGWVKTRMGGAGATRSVEDGADTAVWLAMLPDGGPTGKFFKDRQEIPW